MKITLLKNFLNKLKSSYYSFGQDETAMGTIEIVLILVVLIGLVIIFKGSIIGVLNDILSNIENSAKSIY
jgi:hypothetical protein